MQKMYSIYDKEAEVYSNPFYTDDREDHKIAIRIFKAQIFDRQNLIAMFPDMYELHFIGHFDEKTSDLFDKDNELVITGVDALEELRKANNVQE